jgi:hypothetical protein
MYRLCISANLPEAYLVLHRLEQAGIAARVLNEHAQGGLGEIPFLQAYPEVWVMKEADAVRAQTVLTAFESAEVPPGKVYCSECGEESPRSFEICWHCGQALR